ncbi:MAG: RNA polymerase sigma factor (sigma-70 family) [Limisphaerales bacterium]|jgi:RNA polymerase sigma factor (sigma-70 family)
MNLSEFKNTILPLKHKLFRYAKSILNSAHDAEDAVQEVMIKLWTQRDNLDDIKSLEGWSMTVMRNHCLDRIKSKKHRVVDIQDAYQIKSGTADPGKTTEWRDAYNNVKEIMNGLPENQRTALHLREVEEMTYQEIAESSGMSLDAVKVNLFRARRTVREQYVNLTAYGN